MADENGFFDDVFDTPGDDPLLRDSSSSDEASSSDGPPPPDASPSDGPEHGRVGQPSWMTEPTEQPDSGASSSADSQLDSGNRLGGDDPSAAEGRAAEPSEKTVVVRAGGEGLGEVNEAVKGGWKICHLAPDERPGSPPPSPSTESADAPHTEEEQVLVTLRREQAQSLFDF